jgi:hypothetical protein
MQTYFSSLVKGDKKIVAYASKWKPLTAREYKAEVEESIREYKKGKIISQREMEKRL